MDLKIEIRNLFALQEATIRLEHGVRERIQPSEWRSFAPSRFVYAFFTFNGIYSFDWEQSFSDRKARKWRCKEDGKFPSEEDQFKAYLKLMSNKLGDEAPRLFTDALCDALSLSNLKPKDELKQIKLQNASSKLKNLAEQIPSRVEMLYQGRVKSDDFYSHMCTVIEFVYKVRCNIFHGRKTHIHLQDESQQRRLEVYTALLIATNSLLFETAKIADIGWRDVETTF